MVPFMLGLPCVLFSLAAAIASCDRLRPARLLELALWLALAHIAHPFTFFFAALMVTAVWATGAFRVPYATAGFLLAAVPALLLASHDLAGGGYGIIAGVEAAWPVLEVEHQWLSEVLLGLSVVPFGASGFLSLAAYTPMIAMIVVAFAVAVRCRLPEAASRKRSALILFAALMVVAACVTPRALGTAFLLEPRYGVIAWLTVAMVGGGALPVLGRRRTLCTALAVFGAIAFTGGEFVYHAARIRAIVGPAPPRAASGRLVSARFFNCSGSRDNPPWCMSDPYWHIWAYAVTREAATPQTFAYARYHRVQLRGQAYEQLAGPPDLESLSTFIRAERCEEQNLLRLLWPLLSRQYDGVVTIALPDRLRGALARTKVVVQPLSPGMTLLTMPGHAQAHAQAALDPSRRERDAIR
jgi:hypothetical protein